MIKINYEINGDNMTLSMRGHAGYNPGNDIVCAGCSAVFYSLVGALENMEDDLDSLDTLEESGNAEVMIRGGNEKVLSCFMMAVIGFMQIEKAYGKYVEVEE